MLKTIQVSSNSKLGGCASTYRAAAVDMFGTCPDSCPLKPAHAAGTIQVDQEYLQAVVDAVPRGGVSWTYTHFEKELIPLPRLGKTVINISCDTPQEAVATLRLGYPTVVTVPTSQDSKVEVIDGIRLVRCPAEYNSQVTCNNCGGGIPLCARPDRNYVVKFTAHGTQKRLVGSDRSGGCYGSSGPVAIHWSKTKVKVQEGTDAYVLTRWVRSLPYGTKIRHHVVGDLGAYRSMATQGDL